MHSSKLFLHLSYLHIQVKFLKLINMFVLQFLKTQSTLPIILSLNPSSSFIYLSTNFFIIINLSYKSFCLKFIWYWKINYCGYVILFEVYLMMKNQLLWLCFFVFLFLSLFDMERSTIIVMFITNFIFKFCILFECI